MFSGQGDDRKFRQLSFAMGVAGAVSLAAYLWYRQSTSQAAQLTRFPVVEEIFIYPVKSCRPVVATEWQITPRGLQFDREWIVIKEGDSNTIITVRNCPKMNTVQPSVDRAAGRLTLSHENESTSVSVPLVAPRDRDPSRVVEYTLWKAPGEGYDEGDAVAQWLSRVLGQSVRLLHCTGLRDAGAKCRNVMPPGNEVYAADFASFLIMSSKTVAKLRAESRFPELQSRAFRANLVIGTGRADDEYKFRRLRLREVEFTFVKYCERCIVPSCREDGTYHPKYEPTTTLRKRFSAAQPYAEPGTKGKPLGGINTIHAGVGLVRVGDTLEVLDMGEPPVWTSAEES